MIDTQSITDLTQRQIKSSVDQQIQVLMANEDWINQIEQNIVESIKTRIIAKFSNLSTVPELVDTVKSSVATLFDQGAIPDLKNYVNANLITKAIDRGVTELIDSSINNLLIDPNWVAKIENQVDRTMSDRMSRLLKSIDINALLVTHIDQGITRWQDRMLQNFKTHGITDTATNTELTVMPNAVVVEHELVANNLTVANDADMQGDLTVRNLIVKGRINTDNVSWNELSSKISVDVLESINTNLRDSLVKDIVGLASTTGISFSDVVINGSKLLDGNTLNPVITQTRIEKVGTLEALTVNGPAKLSGTANISSGRVGINTETPEMALSVWDEEVSVIAGKLAKQQAYIGTARLHNLAIGINRIPYIEIDTDGLTTIKQLRLNRNKISFAPEVPGYSGTRGDFVFNSDPKPDSPFGWVCLGSFQWQPLKGA
jgi:hypothetical protein